MTRSVSMISMYPPLKGCVIQADVFVLAALIMGCLKWPLTTASVGLPLGSAISDPGGRLNKKDGLTRYGNSHVKDKTS